MSRNLTRVLLSVVAVAFVASCASKKKGEGSTSVGETTPGDRITEQNMGFDPAGSDSGTIQGLSTVYFDYDQASLTNSARKQLSDNASWIKSNTGTTIQIEGHCDERGSVEYNLALGERRAKAVKSYLVTLGIDGKRLSVISYGKEKPVVQGDTEAAYSKNRRANFVPLPK